MKTKISKSWRPIAVVAIILFGLLAILFVARPSTRNDSDIVATNYVGYDLARTVMGGDQNIRLLIKPGTELHHFEPSPQDIIALQNAKLIIYNGGESDAWLEEMIDNNSIDRSKTLRLMDLVETTEENQDVASDGQTEHNENDIHDATDSSHDHDEHGDSDHHVDDHSPSHHDEDEHIWTSPQNTMVLARGISQRIAELFPDHQAVYTENTENFISALAEVDNAFYGLIKNQTRPLVFADRFPFQYFANDYHLDYIAALPGCVEQAEISSRTLAELVDVVKRHGISTILKVELSSDNIARAIADETGAKILEFHSAHNISQEDFDAGITYLDLMKRNIMVLEEALR